VSDEDATMMSRGRYAENGPVEFKLIPKTEHDRLLSVSSPNADFQNSCAARFISKFAIKSLLNIAPHLNCVATLPCEISVPCLMTECTKLRCKTQPPKKSCRKILVSLIC